MPINIPILFLCLAVTTAAASPVPAPDAFTVPLSLGDGAIPAIALDSQRRLHLVYTHADALWYRSGPVGAELGTPEKILDGRWFHDPRIVIDAEDRPHVVVAEGHTKSRFVYYTNRIGGSWKPPLTVFERERDDLNRATMPNILLESDGSAIVAMFSVGNSTGTTEQWGALARIRDLATAPAVTVRRKIDVWNPQVLMRAGELWVGGRNKVHGNRRFTFQRHHPHTLEEIGEPLPISGKVHGEAARVSAGASGDLHAAGATGGIPAAERGWYNSLARAEAGLPPVRYLTSLENPCGQGMPVEDLRLPGRVYVFYWSDISGDAAEHEHHECRDSEQLHFVRIENGVKVSELNRVTDRSGGHGPSFRLTPAAIPHPDGGVLVVFRECAGGMFLTHIGGNR